MKEHIKDIQILDYLNGSLSAAAREEVGGHLEQCDLCRVRYEEYREVETLLGRWQVDEIQQDMTDAILSRIGLKPSKVIRAGGHWTLRQVMRTAASVAAALLIGHFAGRYSLSQSSVTETVNDDVIAQALYMDILIPGSATGWSQIVLESEQDDNSEAQG